MENKRQVITKLSKICLFAQRGNQWGNQIEQKILVKRKNIFAQI